MNTYSPYIKIPEFSQPLWRPSAFLLKKFTRRFWRLFFSAIGPRYTLTEVDGIRTVVDLKDLQGVSKELLKKGRFEDFARGLAKDWIAADSSVIDIGANIGFWSIECSKFTRGKIFAFEPDPENLKLLRANLDLNHRVNVSVVPKACGAQRAVLKLYRSKSNAGDHQLYQTSEKREGVQVEVCSIDEEIGVLKDLSFVKIDVQGFEHFALQGMEHNLRANQNVTILCEFWPDGMRQAGSQPDAFLDWMEQLGFRMRVIPHLEDRIYTLEREKLYELCSNGRYVDLVFSR